MTTQEKRLIVEVVDFVDASQLARLARGLEFGTDRVTFWGDEWAQRRPACEAFVAAREGRFDRRLGARRCVVLEVPRADAAAFLDAYHLQGSSRLSLVVFGLYDDGDLLGVLSLGRHNRQLQVNMVLLDRLCFKPGVQVIGGASRLMSQAITWAQSLKYEQIVTFSDLRLTDGDVYERLGFSLDRRYKPDYFYVQNGNRISKQSQQKRCTGCPDDVTELEWAEAHGLVRCYDAGKVRWAMDLVPGIQAAYQQANSERAAKMHADGVFNNSHMRGYFRSQRWGEVYFGSSYELRCMFELEQDRSVRSVRRCEAFQTSCGNWRNPDLWVEFSDGHAEIWEVKPSILVDQDVVREQIADTMIYAMSKGVSVRVWTEQSSSLDGERSIMKWARSYLAEQQGDTSHVDREKRTRKAIRERHYKKEQAASVVVHCDYCQADHMVLPRTYARNVARNKGVYVCERYGGHLAGKKPKDHLKVTNPYAVEGKKKCSRCGEVREMTEFDRRMRSWDGLNATCKRCASAYNAAKYQQRKHANLGSPVEEIACDLHGA